MPDLIGKRIQEALGYLTGEIPAKSFPPWVRKLGSRLSKKLTLSRDTRKAMGRKDIVFFEGFSVGFSISFKHHFKRASQKQHQQVEKTFQYLASKEAGGIPETTSSFNSEFEDLCNRPIEYRERFLKGVLEGGCAEPLLTEGFRSKGEADIIQEFMILFWEDLEEKDGPLDAFAFIAPYLGLNEDGEVEEEEAFHQAEAAFVRAASRMGYTCKRVRKQLKPAST